jgi:D-alanyl-D-alanine carboxypeptidase (penicillin-binding protein 5/6)
MTRSPRTNVVPIASLTKMMTAYLVLRDHPLAAGAVGPTFVMDKADVAAYVHANQTGQSNVPVALGERLTEHQLLEALLLPSANNIADYLATWDAGSMAAFVVKMNAAARALGMTHTHYADASGFNPGSRSDATDQAVLAATLMENPVVRGIVSKRSLPFPVAGTIWNYNPGLGVGGIIGVKSGFTSQAQGCLATAAYRTAAGHHVLVVAVTLGQTGGLREAARVDEQLLDSAGSSLVGYRVPLPSGSLGTVSFGGTAIPLYATGSSPLIVGWPGMELRERVVARPLRPSATPDGVLADLAVSAPGGTTVSVPLTAATVGSTKMLGAGVFRRHIENHIRAGNTTLR